MPLTHSNGKSKQSTPTVGGGGSTYGITTRFKPASTIQWSDCDAGIVHALVSSVTRAGDAVLFGRTSDGGALVITVLEGDQRHKFYPSSVEEAEELMTDLSEAARSRSGQR